jgi:hypothetical protein
MALSKNVITMRSRTALKAPSGNLTRQPGLEVTMPAGKYKLYIGKAFTGVTVEPDDQWPNMWRIRKGDRISDMVNLTRARDAAVAWARPKGLGGEEIASWRLRE